MTFQVPTWGAGVRFLRTTQGLSQVELSSLSGVPQATISRLENGSTKISDTVRVRIARALQVDPHTLFPYLEDVAS